MSTQVNLGEGKLYLAGSEQFVGTINYQIYEELAGRPAHWWGELTLTDILSIHESDRYIIELEDKRRGRCSLRKRVNRAVSGIPPRYTYHITGISHIE